MNSLSELSSLVQIELVDCPPTLCINALRRAVREFLRRTGAWREDLTYDLVADQTDYTLASAVLTATIYRIIGVNINAGDGDDLNATEYEFYDNVTLALDAAPVDALTDGLVLEVAIIPPIVGTDFTDSGILDRWGEAFQAKAIAIQASQKKKPWSDPDLAAEKQIEYTSAIKACLVELSTTGFKQGQAYRANVLRQFSNRPGLTTANSQRF